MPQSKVEHYNKEFLEENMMGPNSMRILEELMDGISLKKGSRVLDLGCGRGLTSVFLAKEYDVQVFAVDLWISATDNQKRFAQLGLDQQIIPIDAQADDLPFAEDFFDAVISVDSYHYFGNNDTFFNEKLRPYLKKNALVALAFPGMKCEVHDHVPEDMKPFWEEEALPMWQSVDWWTQKLQKSLTDFQIQELSCYDDAWNDWLSTDNPYAVQDRKMIKADGGRFMNLIGLTGKTF